MKYSARLACFCALLCVGGCTATQVRWTPHAPERTTPPRACQNAMRVYDDDVQALTTAGATLLGRLSITTDALATHVASDTGAQETLAARTCDAGGTHYVIVSNAAARGTTRSTLDADVYRMETAAAAQ